MKRLVLILVLGLALNMLFALERKESANSKSNSIFFGISNSSLSESVAGENKFQPANGFHIGVTDLWQLKIKGKNLFELEEVYKYAQRNYKINYDDVVERSYLDISLNLRYDFLDWEFLYPYIGVGASWLLSGPHQSKTWISDIPLTIGIEFFPNFRYEYSHGTFSQTILDGHKAKTNTHSFTFIVKIPWL
ncbi:MAG: hypothetical protein FWG98_06525 [Candidatus Cloacimonetes bacterium]|nr:hypothetical protein [Candidatus Cloacimonadota bacterium]